MTNCLRCKSIRITNFVDGFGEKRVFCRTCWLSSPQESFIKFGAQKRLHEFDAETYNKPKIYNWGEF